MPAHDKLNNFSEITDPENMASTQPYNSMNHKDVQISTPAITYCPKYLSISDRRI